MTYKTIVFLAEFSVMALVWLAFVILYAVLSRGLWRKSPAGRHLMSVGLVFVWNCALILFNVAAGQYPGRFVVQVVSYAGFIAVGVHRITLILREERRRRAQARAARAGEALASLQGTPRQ